MEELAAKQLLQSFYLLQESNNYMYHSYLRLSQVINKIMLRYDSYSQFAKMMKQQSRYSSKQNSKIERLEKMFNRYFDYFARLLRNQYQPQQQLFDKNLPFRNDLTPAVAGNFYGRRDEYY